MRKVLSLVLVLALVLGSVALAFAAPMSDVKGTKYEDSVNVLTELGVVTGYPDGSYKPAGIVTRAEMAVIVVRALGLADHASGVANFKDMGGHWANPYVAWANSLGVIAGYPDGTFKPDNTVSYDEAATMLVAALGYTPESLVGTWPANYVVKAKTLGILDGIKGGAAGANRGDIAIMTFQTLGQAIGKVNKDGKWEAFDIGTPTTPKDDTMMGRLDAMLFAPTGAGSEGDAFVLTNTHANDAVANVKDLVGAYVTAYANSDNEIIAIEEVKSVFLTGKFDANMLANGWAIGDVFEGADKDYDLIGDSINNMPTVATAVAPVEFVNGAQGGIPGGVVAGDEYKIAADVSGVKIKEVYSVSKWTQNGDFLYEDGMLEDDNINSFDFTLDDNDEIDYKSFELVGVDALADIEEDNVVYVYIAAGEITKIEVGTEVVEGEVTRISSNDEKITVDGKVYQYADDKFVALSSAVSNGSVSLKDEVVLYLDVNGYIYDMDVNTKTGGNFAIILETSNEVSGLSGNPAKVKLFLADGTDKVFEVDVDEVSATSLLSATGVWTASAIAGGMLVEYGLDNDGAVDYLKDVTADTNYDATLVGGGTDYELTSKLTYFGIPVSSDAILFTVDSAATGFDPTDEEFYGVTTTDKAKGSEFEAAYYAKNNKITLMVIDGTGTDTDIEYGVVTSWSQDAGSSTDYVVTMLVGGVETEYDVKGSIITTAVTGLENDVNAKKKIYEITFNTAGEVTALTDVSAGVATEIDILATLAPSVAYANGALDGTTIDSDAIAYMMKTGETEFEKVSITKANLQAMSKVVLYDTDEDLIADILLITE